MVTPSKGKFGSVLKVSGSFTATWNQGVYALH